MVGGGEAEIAMRGAGDRALKALVSTDDNMASVAMCHGHPIPTFVDEIEEVITEKLCVVLSCGVCLTPQRARVPSLF